MGRRDEWQQIRNSMLQQTTFGSVDKWETVPDKACGLCKSFRENAYGSDGRGSCDVLKFGSDISTDPPVLVTQGDTGLITFFNTEASKCPHYDRSKLIDTDGRECADPMFRRMQRQMEKRVEDAGPDPECTGPSAP